jgi:O-antigen ligase
MARNIDQRIATFAILVVTVVAVSVLPTLVKYLHVTHEATIIDSDTQLPLAKALSLVSVVTLYLVCAFIVFARGESAVRVRSIGGLAILLFGLIVPYAISPTVPDPVELVKVGLTVAVFLAVWCIGAPVDGLKWISITASLIGAYSLIGLIVVPDHFNSAPSYRGSPNLTKSIISDWILAGPFWGGNTLGLYCVLALALTPLVASVRWKVTHASILSVTIIASASRTAIIAAAILALWWLVCRSRSKAFVHAAGVVLIGCCVSIVLALPFANSNPLAFSGRGYAWAASIGAWQESPLTGLGISYVAISSRTVSLLNPYSWSYHHGHNLIVDTLLKSGLVGCFVVVCVLIVAIRSIFKLDNIGHQTALLGFLLVFLIASSSEAIWYLIPTMPLFPVVALVFATVICHGSCRSNSFDSHDSFGSGRLERSAFGL